MVFQDQLVGGEPHIPEKALAPFEAANRLTGIGWQVRHGVIAPSAGELLTEIARPVLRSHLPTVDMDHGPATARGGFPFSNLSQELANIGIVMCIERGSIELVYFKTQTRVGGRTGDSSVVALSHPEYGPFS